MDNKKNGIPKLRFPGFTGAWEQRKLGEMSHIETGKLDANAMVKNGKYDFYTSGIKKYHIDTPAFKGPAITIAGNGATVGYMHLADGEFNAYQRTYVLTKFSANRSFIFIEIGNKLPRKIQQESRAGNIPYIVMDMLTDLKIVLPSLAEQEKIGNFFNELNSLITLHQRKLKHLQEQKKGLLQKMFPKNGETVPEVRFPGFTDAWEQRKLNEFLKTSKLKNENNKFTRKDVLSVSGDYGIVNQIKFKGRSFAGASVQKYRIVNTNDVVYTKSPLKNNPYGIIKANKGNPGIVSTLYAVYKINEKVNASFIEYYFENDYRLNTYLKPLVNKGAKNDMKVSDDNALIGNVIFPLEYSEQIKIVKFLNRFDTLIALHQRKLDHLELMKKGLLQQMFV